MKFSSIQILKLFRHLSGKPFDDIALMTAVGEVFEGDPKPITQLPPDEYYQLAAIMNALLDQTGVPQDTSFSEDEIAVVEEAYAEFCKEQDGESQPAPQPNGNPAISETLSDEEVQLLVRSTEFVPPNLGTFKRLAKRSPLIDARLVSPNGEAKLAEVASVLQAVRSGAASPALSNLDGNEEVAIRAAKDELDRESNTSRMSAEFVLRLQQLLLKGAKPEAVREALLGEFPDAATQALLLTGSFEGLIRVIASVATGKGEVLKGTVAELRDCEIEQLKTAFGKSVQPPVALTPEIISIIAQASETEQDPGSYPEVRGIEKRKLHNVVAVMKTFTKAGENRVGAASRYGLTDAELLMVLEVMRSRSPVQDQHLTRAEFVEMFQQYQAEQDPKAPAHVVKKEGEGAARMIRDNLRCGGGLLKTPLCYGLEPAQYNQFLRWLGELARTERLLRPQVKSAPGLFYRFCNHPKVKPYLTLIFGVVVFVAVIVFYLWARNIW